MGIWLQFEDAVLTVERRGEVVKEALVAEDRRQHRRCRARKTGLRSSRTSCAAYERSPRDLLENWSRTTAGHNSRPQLTHVLAVRQDSGAVFVPCDPLAGIFARHRLGAVRETRREFAKANLHGSAPPIKDLRARGIRSRSCFPTCSARTDEVYTIRPKLATTSTGCAMCAGGKGRRVVPSGALVRRQVLPVGAAGPDRLQDSNPKTALDTVD